MVQPLRHRQTKEAANRYVQPTATAPHLDSTLRDILHRHASSVANGGIAEIDSSPSIAETFGQPLKVGRVCETLNPSSLSGVPKRRCDQRWTVAAISRIIR